jgi:hypothetical protein
MPRETAIVVAAIAVPFIIFAVTLIWTDFTMRKAR